MNQKSVIRKYPKELRVTRIESTDSKERVGGKKKCVGGTGEVLRKFDGRAQSGAQEEKREFEMNAINMF